MLHLERRTAADWGPRATAVIDEILLDHAHLEKKAASTALTLIFRYPDRAPLLAPLSALAREELEHFERVLGELAARSLPFERQRPSTYPGRLMAAVRAGEPDKLVDTLLCCALIEARSCERMQRLAEALPPGRLQALYADLLTSEARHHRLYLDLAAEVVPAEAVRARLAELARHEATVIRDDLVDARLHA
ncbi:MAG: tRNA-(ms[2]io[6]A)-hydroxylase [Myxococcales bacterium]|nr:tRNA-(ms[2]io[6]A)-hydroxylase [Myxococcales bacterium]